MRLVAVVSLLANGETQDAWSFRTRRLGHEASDGKPDGRKRQTTHRDGKGWLEAEWTEGATKHTGIPVQDKRSRLEAKDGRGRTIPKTSWPGRSVGRHGRYEAAEATSRNGPWA